MTGGERKEPRYKYETSPKENVPQEIEFEPSLDLVGATFGNDEDIPDPSSSSPMDTAPRVTEPSGILQKVSRSRRWDKSQAMSFIFTIRATNSPPPLADSRNIPSSPFLTFGSIS